MLEKCITFIGIPKGSGSTPPSPRKTPPYKEIVIAEIEYPTNTHKLIKAGVYSSFFIHKKYIPRIKIKKKEEIIHTKCVRAWASHKSFSKCVLPKSTKTGTKHPPNKAMLVKTLVSVNLIFLTLRFHLQTLGYLHILFVRVSTPLIKVKIISSSFILRVTVSNKLNNLKTITPSSK